MESIKEKIITIIEQTHDDDLLGRIFEFLENEIQEENAVFSDKQMESILKAKDQFEKGKVKTQKEIDIKFEEWMRK
ncbi:hypothetical protein [Aquiflexum sp.]|uniref:hypothetical protein n=1 Tax=Aquiflexum sp. TaxID=1872584 RepID=UPI003593E341